MLGIDKRGQIDDSTMFFLLETIVTRHFWPPEKILHQFHSVNMSVWRYRSNLVCCCFQNLLFSVNLKQFVSESVDILNEILLVTQCQTCFGSLCRAACIFHVMKAASANTADARRGGQSADRRSSSSSAVPVRGFLSLETENTDQIWVYWLFRLK